jgi:hypothetical protein
MNVPALHATILQMKRAAGAWQRDLNTYLDQDGDVREEMQSDYEETKDGHAWPVLEVLGTWAAELEAASGMKTWTLLHTSPTNPGIHSVHLTGTSLRTALTAHILAHHPEWAQFDAHGVIVEYLRTVATDALVVKGHRTTRPLAARFSG